MLPWFEKLLNSLTNILPVHKWVGAATNLVRLTALYFVVVGIIFLGLVFGAGNATPGRRFTLELVCLGFLPFGLVVIALLALWRGVLVYGAYEASLERGEKYGSESKRAPRRDVMSEPAQAEEAGVPPPGPSEESTRP